MNKVLVKFDMIKQEEITFPISFDDERQTIGRRLDDLIAEVLAGGDTMGRLTLDLRDYFEIARAEAS